MRNGGQGSMCDCCGKILLSFDTTKLVARHLVKGEKYQNVSSDVVTRDFYSRHLCKNCFGKIKNYINNMQENK